MPVTSIKWDLKGQEQLQLQTPADKKYDVNSGSDCHIKQVKAAWLHQLHVVIYLNIEPELYTGWFNYCFLSFVSLISPTLFQQAFQVFINRIMTVLATTLQLFVNTWTPYKTVPLIWLHWLIAQLQFLFISDSSSTQIPPRLVLVIKV